MRQKRSRLLRTVPTDKPRNAHALLLPSAWLRARGRARRRRLSPVRGGGDPMDSMAYHAVTENGSAASELRYRCA
jgi:hypothetical protein